MQSFCKAICVFSGLLFPLALLSQTISTGSVAGSPFCPGATILVPYAITGSFNAGNVFTVELSDATGSFASPVIIGTVTAVSAGSITANLPVAQAAGLLYRIRVVADNPAVMGSNNGADLTVTAASSPVFSHTKTWTGGTGNWNNPSNWSPCGLPNGASNVMIGSGAVITLLAGVSSSVLTVQMSGGAKLNIAGTAMLNINGGTTAALQMIDAGTTLDNSGALNIGNILPTATGINLFSGSVFMNNAGGSLSINDITSNLVNSGHGISISGNSIFTNAGGVQIGGNKAIRRYGILLFAGQLNNQSTGVMEINRITSFDGIVGNGTGVIKNEGNIRIGNVAAVSQAGININAGVQLTNETTGTIEINRITLGDGLAGNSATTTITNAGNIRIGNMGSLNRSGISLFNSCIFNNLPGATITIDQIVSTAANEGRGMALSTSSSFINAGSLKVGNTTAIYRSAIFAGSGKFTNQTAGVVELNRTTLLDGISGNGSGNVNNSGSIKIGNVASIGQSGINLNSGFQFTNQAGATLEVNNTATSPAIYTNGTSSLITNAGLIKIGHQTSLAYGLLLFGGGKFMNETNGAIEIDNAVGEGSGCLGIIGTGSTFTNGGSLMIGKNAPLDLRGIEMDAGGTFINQATGTAEVISTTANGAEFNAMYLGGASTLFDNFGSVKIQIKAPVLATQGVVLNGSIFNNKGSAKLELNIIQ